MVSLKRLLNLSQVDAELRTVASLLLGKIGSGAVQCAFAGYEPFRAEISRLQESVTAESTPEALFVAAASASQAMESYNREVSALFRKQSVELRSIVSMIAETAITVGGESARSAERLQEIGERFEHAGNLDDLLVLKSHLKECLKSFRDEAERRKTESDKVIQSLQREVAHRNEQLTTSALMEDLDIVTGLPQLVTGINFMQEAMKSGQCRYVVVMVVNRIKLLNLRYGAEVGNRVLRAFAEAVEHKLAAGDRVFRWNGPAIVGLLDRIEPIEMVRAQVRRILETRLEETFEVDERFVTIPISASWSMFPLLPPLVDVTKQLQTFIAAQGGRDYV